MLLNYGAREDFQEWVLTARSNQSILKDVNPEYSLEGLMMKLKLQYFDHLMWSANSLDKTLNLGKIWGQEEKGTTEDEMVVWHHWFNGHDFEQTLVILKDREAWSAAAYGIIKSGTQLSNCRTTTRKRHRHTVTEIEISKFMLSHKLLLFSRLATLESVGETVRQEMREKLMLQCWVQKQSLGISLVLQWLRIHLAMHGTRVRS